MSATTTSRTVHYVPLSADAAIAGEDFDFRFTNSNDDPIIVIAKASGGELTFAIYGKETREEGREVEFESVTTSTIAPGVTTIKDSSLAKGKKVTESEGETGYTAELWKVVTVNGKETERTKFNKSTISSGQEGQSRHEKNQKKRQRQRQG